MTMMLLTKPSLTLDNACSEFAKTYKKPMTVDEMRAGGAALGEVSMIRRSHTLCLISFVILIHYL